MTKTIKQIGKLVVDSGKLIICDPLFLRDWKDDSNMDLRTYRDSRSGKTYTYKIDFHDYQEEIDGQKIKSLIEQKILERVPSKVNQEFSYNNLNNQLNENGIAQFHFLNGNIGLAFGFLAGDGDGEYAVYAEWEDEKLKKVWIEF